MRAFRREPEDELAEPHVERDVSDDESREKVAWRVIPGVGDSWEVREGWAVLGVHASSICDEHSHKHCERRECREGNRAQQQPRSRLLCRLHSHRRLHATQLHLMILLNDNN